MVETLKGFRNELQINEERLKQKRERGRKKKERGSGLD
jgi:hypothetical protein